MFYIIFDINVLYPAKLLKLMSELLRVWVDDAQKAEIVEDLEVETHWNRKYKIYTEVFEAYVFIAKIFPSLVSQADLVVSIESRLDIVSEE